MSAKGFNDLRKRRPRATGCARCGEPTAGQVQIRLVDHHGSASGKGNRSIDAMARSLCEPCAVIVWDAVANAFDTTIYKASA